MKIYAALFLSLFTLGLCSEPTAGALSCDHIIGQKVYMADGRTNYSLVRPGQTVCISAGSRGYLTLQNFEGTASSPILFVNYGGLVLLNTPASGGGFAITVKNSRYFRLTGTGDSAYEYGIKVDGPYSMGVKAGQKSSDMEIDHIEVANTTINGIRANTHSTCSDGSNNDYDYDGDGKKAYDLDDVVTKENFTQYNTKLHDNFLHDIGQEGFYVGYNRTVYAPYAQGSPSNCATPPTEPLNPVLKNVWIYSNLIQRTGTASVTVKGTPENCSIYSNRIYQSSTAFSQGQEGGIHLNLNAHCDVYNNFIKDSVAAGIIAAGTGGKIFNNIIVNSGGGFKSTEPRGSAIHVLSGTSETNYYVWNNSIVNPKSFGVYFTYRFGSDNRIQNNIIAHPGAYDAVGDSGYVYRSSKARVTVSSNLKYFNMDTFDFMNPFEDNYSLNSNSPAVDTGTDLSPYGISFDYSGVARAQGGAFDIGAYEYMP
jgi:hypothetical protein